MIENGTYEVKTQMSKGNYVGLTVTLDRIRVKKYTGNKRDRSSYRVTVKWLEKASSNYKIQEDLFEVRQSHWDYSNPLEAAAKFKFVRDNVRNLGEFRNLNKSKIPDYRDEPK